jgi:hypothetical protein
MARIVCRVAITMTDGSEHVYNGCPLNEALGLDDSWRAGKRLRLIGPTGVHVYQPEEVEGVVVERSDAS